MSTVSRSDLFLTLYARLIALACILGSSLTAVAATLYLVGIGRNPGLMSWGSREEGVLGAFSFVMLIPGFVALAQHLGAYKPRLAALATVTALFGFGVGAVTNMAYRVFIPELMDVGVTVAMLDQLQIRSQELATSAGFNLVIFVGVLCPLTSLVLGIGYLRAGVCRSRGALLLAAGILFPIGQLGLQGLAYWLATVSWSIVLVPFGLRLFAANPAPAAGKLAHA